MPTELITKNEHEHQIKAYREQYHVYVEYANALKEVLEKACKCSVPEALVQSRAKTVSSFAEKCVRKYDKYKDAVNQFTDLCGARVIVQTIEQVQAVRNFIEANFKIIEKEDKGLLLQQDEFGYRDMHYVVQLPYNRNIGFSANHIDKIGERKAEIQVRTWVQHAWADTLHDRMYKAKLRLSPEVNRTGALLAAIMEDGDRTFSQLASEIDGIVANYSEYAIKSEVDNEVEIQKLLLENEPENTKKPLIALQVSKLLAASGEYGQVIEVLTANVEKASGALKSEIDLHLGSALCKARRNNPESRDFEKGLALLLKVVKACECQDIIEVPDIRKQKNVKARAHAYLGWSYAQQRDKTNSESMARFHYQAALECEPDNPYLLSDVLCYEIYCTRNREIGGSMRATILEAVRTCSEHAVRNTEMPYACFTAGRLELLLGSCEDPTKHKHNHLHGYNALGWYARGIQHFLFGEFAVPTDLLEGEIEWMRRVNSAVRFPDQFSWNLKLLEMADTLNRKRLGFKQGSAPQKPRFDIDHPVLVVAGGAASMKDNTVRHVRSLLFPALEQFAGTVISGGTDIGVPGCVGDIADELEAVKAKTGKKGFKLFGYVTERFTGDAPQHNAYDRVHKTGTNFNPEHVLFCWEDILAAEIDPKDVMLLGFGGGSLSAVEYQIGVAFGASVGVVLETGGVADEIAENSLWSTLPNLYPLPADAQTICSFVIPAKTTFDSKTLDEMAKSFHKKYLETSEGHLPPNMRSWPNLDETFKRASLEQAKYCTNILEAMGFMVQKVQYQPAPFQFEDGDKDKVAMMAAMEHGRWNIERLRDGWRFGKNRDDSLKIHDCLISWEKLPEETKSKDRKSVEAFPEILARAGFEIRRVDSDPEEDEKS